MQQAAGSKDEYSARLAKELLDAGEVEPVQLSLARALLAQGLAGPALGVLQGAENVASPDPRALALEGYALTRAGRLDRAEGLIRRSLALDQRQSLAQFFLGGLLRLKGDREGAARALDAAAQRERGNPALYVELADALVDVADYGDADQSMKLAVKAAPDSAEVRLAAARFRVDNQYRVEDALEDAEAAVRLSGRSPESLATLGWALHLSGRSAEALGPLVEAVAKAPESALLRYRLGSIYDGLGQRDRAKEQYLMVGELDGRGDLWKRAKAALDGMGS